MEHMETTTLDDEATLYSSTPSNTKSTRGTCQTESTTTMEYGTHGNMDDVQLDYIS